MGMGDKCTTAAVAGGQLQHTAIDEAHQCPGVGQRQQRRFF